MRLIDKHLGKLTNGSQPRDRLPYTGQVKFAPTSQNSVTDGGYSEEKTKELLSELDQILTLGEFS